MKRVFILGFLQGSLLLAATAQKPKSKTKFIDPANMDLGVKPGDDFFSYANGNWVKNNPVPASKTRWGSFDILYLGSLEKIKSLCEDAAANASKNATYQRVGDLYLSAMDSAGIEQLGFTPIKEELDRLNGLTTLQDVVNEIATIRTKGIGSALFGFRIDQDDKNVNQYIATLSQGGTSLPDRDYYLKQDARNQTIRAEYVKYITDMFKLVGDDEATATKKAAAIMGIETGLAKAQLSRVELRDPVKTYNKFSTGDFTKTTPGLDWKALFTAMKAANADSLLVNNPAFFKTADALLSAVTLDSWKAYLQWAVIKSAAPYLSSAFVNRQFEFGRVLTGQKQMTPRWQRMSSLVDNNLGELLGQLYVEKYFDNNAKQRMLALVKNVQETFASRIQRLDWMSDSTKQRALEKLQAIVNKIGFPDKWETYPGVTISKTGLVANLRSINQFEYNKMVNKLGQPVDKTEWGMTPPTINAYYNPANNEIAFPAGILQFPFFDFGADDAVNYGGIAAVIGHELTHGFDDQGRQYAADGNLKDWWTADDAKKFEERANKVVEQYNGFVVNDSLHLNGKLTLGENLADLGGLNIAYEAFKKTEQGKSDKKIDGFTPDQRFFLGWAQVWRQTVLPETSAQLVLVDPHSPGKYRANGPVQNMDAFYKAFNVQPGDKMYKPESERIKVW
ncbi:M13 family metallopeptidase [Foetidibacter luteolus]|uniref:M13 family metallopeptidase n=1 Tax=Foetidibacter luteolus TaxID=2608880 RepID=UPI00129BBA46|nr:M13 family metallopeptidase [Foetidibacter luteolus]